MTAQRIGDLDPGTTAWLSVMSASKVAAMLGLSPWESPYSLWQKMAGRIEADEQTDAMERGHYLEPAIAAWFADEHPALHVRPAGTYRHTDRPWQVASPDRLLSTTKRGKPTAILEIKTANKDWEWGTQGTDEIPIYYRCQVMWQLDVLGMDRAYVAVLTPYMEFRWYLIEYDADEAAYLRTQAEAFMGSIAAGDEPDIDATDHTYQALRKLHPDIEDRDHELEVDLAHDWYTAQREVKAAEFALLSVKNRVTQAMGTARRAVYGKTTYAMRQSRKKADGTPGTPFVVVGRGLLDKEGSTAA